MKKYHFLFFSLFCFLGCINFQKLNAQEDLRRISQGGRAGLQNNIQYDSQGRIIKSTSKTDSLKRRDASEDSITIYYRLFDSSRLQKIDSSVSDFYKRFPFAWHQYHLGNYGTASNSFYFSPRLTTGFNIGFHAFDAYKLEITNTKFYQTTRPYTELGYLLGSNAEQIVQLLHTQNFKSNLNVSFEYRLISTPGIFRNQNVNHNNIRLSANYQSKNRRYGLQAIFINNKLKAGENGGIKYDSLLSDVRFKDRFLIPTRLGSLNDFSRNPFSSVVKTGNLYSENKLYAKQYYDIGKIDSVFNIADSNFIKIFYTRFRVQHVITSSSSTFEFLDTQADSANYKAYFNKNIRSNTNVQYKDQWKDLTNEVSIITYPQQNNVNQFLRIGAAFQSLQGNFDTISIKTNNLFLVGEYRNRTRNGKWDVEANSQIYLSGFNSGDYNAAIKLKRNFGNKNAFLETGFQNLSRTASYIFNNYTSFPLIKTGTFNKENLTKIYTSLLIPKIKTGITANYFLIGNYIYFDSFFTAKQEASVFNILQLQANRKTKLSKHWNLYTELIIQKATGNAPVNVPLLLTRNRIAFEGNFYKNLFLSTGVEIKYNTAFNADGYSPMMGQFYLQNNISFNNKPEINAFFHFNIKRFYGFVRFENLNTLSLQDGFNFTKNNIYAPHYPGLGFWFRLGISWNFIN